MRNGTHLRIAVAVMLAAATTALAPTAVAAVRPGGRPAPAWHVSQAGQLSSTAVLFGLSSTGANDAWAAGLQSFDGVSQGVILRWNGKRWQRQTTGDVPATGVWHALDAASPHDVWAYGWSETRETLAHFNGRTWADVPLPQLPPEQGYGFAKLAAVPGRVWLVNDSLIMSYTRGHWRRTPLPSGVQISALDARTADDAWAVGQFALAGAPTRSVAMHWNGRTWTEVSPSGDYDLTAVYQENAHSVWATGLTPWSEDAPQQTKVLHWNGKTWRDVTGPVTGLSAAAISGDREGTVWVSGDPDGYEGPALYWRYRHGTWTRVDGDTVPGGTTQSYVVEALAPVGRTGRFWSVGDYERITGEATSATYELIQRSTR
jgi:hypothetical protein